MTRAPAELRADDITVRFGGLTAVDGVSLEVPPAGFVGLIGPNGAGKTTTFNVISGFQTASAGRISYGGTDVTSLAAPARARMGIGRTFQRLELFGRMTVLENLMVAAESAESRVGVLADVLNLPSRRSEERRCAGIALGMLEMLGLDPVSGRRAGDLPVGTARVLELGRALCASPSLLLLDEPSSGLDTEETQRFGELLRRVNEEMGIGILIVEHDMDLVLDVCREIYVLDFGRLITHGRPDDVMRDARVRSAYLGEEDDGAAAETPQR